MKIISLIGSKGQECLTPVTKGHFVRLFGKIGESGDLYIAITTPSSSGNEDRAEVYLGPANCMEQMKEVSYSKPQKYTDDFKTERGEILIDTIENRGFFNGQPIIAIYCVAY